MDTYTITFGDRAENHRNMQIIGDEAVEGFNIDDLRNAQNWFSSKGIKSDIYDLSAMFDHYAQCENLNLTADRAFILIAKNGLSSILNSADFYNELSSLNKDTQAFMYGRVVNKHARHNLCFDVCNQEPDYENKKGRIVSFSDVPCINSVLVNLPNIIGNKAHSLKAELNHYFDISKCGIGWHGDTERKLVVGVRSGAPMSLCYKWFYQCKSVGSRMDFNLGDGDIYIMSEKAVGNDWKSRSIPTLRHAAGSRKFIS